MQKALNSRGSPLSPDYFAHRFPARGLQWSEAAPREKPYAFIFVAAVNKIDTIAHHGVVECGAGILGNDPEKRLSPRIIRKMKDLFTERVQFFHADVSNGFRDVFAP